MTPVVNKQNTAPLNEHREVATRTVRIHAPAGQADHDELPPREGEILSLGTAPGNDLVLRDPTVSGYHLELRAVSDGIQVLDLGSTNGTFSQGMRIQRAVVPAGTTLKLGRTLVQVEHGQQARASLADSSQDLGLIGQSEKMRRLFATIAKAAQASGHALIQGETGTGKELVARALHELGPRAAQPFVTVDCAALSAERLASELFGHEDGAIPGVTGQRIGAFERAAGGVLFLDEVGELPIGLQPKFLGVLERGTFQRVGGHEEIQVDVRVLSATNRDIRREVNEGSFRLDLYYRIAPLVLKIPPLRERREDIPFLLAHFLAELGFSEPVPPLHVEAALRELSSYRWPGNVRELRNWLESAAILGPSGDPVVGEEVGEGADPLTAQSYKSARATVLHEFERDYLARLVRRADSNISKAARLASMDRSYLIKLLARHRIQ